MTFSFLANLFRIQAHIIEQWPQFIFQNTEMERENGWMTIGQVYGMLEYSLHPWMTEIITARLLQKAYAFLNEHIHTVNCFCHANC
jgi:hypothetical protein